MLVDNILQGKGTTVHTVAGGAPISDAIGVLNRNRIGAVVVVDAKGNVTGILSERDVVRKMGDDPTAFLTTPVERVMTRTVVTCGRQDTVASLMEKMTQHRIRHVPVTEDGALCGIVSIGDVVKRKIEETEQEALALREYIQS